LISCRNSVELRLWLDGSGVCYGRLGLGGDRSGRVAFGGRLTKGGRRGYGPGVAGRRGVSLGGIGSWGGRARGVGGFCRLARWGGAEKGAGCRGDRGCIGVGDVLERRVGGQGPAWVRVGEPLAERGHGAEADARVRAVQTVAYRLGQGHRGDGDSS